MAIVAIVPDKLGAALSRLQRELDPEAPMPPHIPLVAPFVAQPPFLPLERHCWRTGHESPPFWVELGELELNGEAPFVRLPVRSGGEQLAALRDALLASEHVLAEGDASGPRAFAARLSHRGDLAISKFDEPGAGAGHRTFLLERFELMTQYPDGSWYERDFYTLDRTVART